MSTVFEIPAQRFPPANTEAVASDEIYITEALLKREPKNIDYLREKLALQDLARRMVDHPSDVLPHLVDLAIEICGGNAGGISLYEAEPAPGIFRWHFLRGDLVKFTGCTTPRNNSPCGVTLDRRTPVLATHPERFYAWLAEAGVALPECLLVPLHTGGALPIGTLWIVSPGEGHFDSGHARIMTELAAFAGMAMRMVSAEERLERALEQQQRLTTDQETLTKEMGHPVKNLFSIFGGLVRISARNATSPQEMVESLSGRLDALAAAHAVVRSTFAKDGLASQGSKLEEIIKTILRPHVGPSGFGRERLKSEGPETLLGDHATNSFALVLHELATNAAKYGALKSDMGSLRLNWFSKEERLHFTWQERGGPAISGEPTTKGFGSVLAQNAVVAQLGGTLSYDWAKTGLQVAISVPANRLLS